MHPSFSIVFFTTASGAGFGLMFLLGLGVPLGLLPIDPWFGLTSLATAVVLAVGGLVSSAFHLGRPERAWRAFSQWRSSWLSREGVLSVVTLTAAAVFAVGWIFFGAFAGISGLFGIFAAVLAAATICCTAMIYASLKP
ncbi:MAG TPA: DmsC/YnfH family molybdoenzyme membrane anchor subunit, partial [Stellaceae bacterium]